MRPNSFKLFRMCGCASAVCVHGWHATFRVNGLEYRFDLQALLQRPVRRKGDAHVWAINVIEAIRNGEPAESVRVPLREYLVELLNGEHRSGRSIGTVYFVADGELVKIGWTKKTAAERMVNLQSGNPRPLVLVATMPGNLAVEEALHDHFADFRVTGEWFRTEPLLVEFMDALNARPIRDTLAPSRFENPPVRLASTTPESV